MPTAVFSANQAMTGETCVKEETTHQHMAHALQDKLQLARDCCYRPVKSQFQLAGNRIL
jgi:hypothetical protein